MNPDPGQTVVNVTDGKLIRLLVEDEPTDLRYGHSKEHTRTLDFHSGALRRHPAWVSDIGRTKACITETADSTEGP